MRCYTTYYKFLIKIIMKKLVLTAVVASVLSAAAISCGNKTEYGTGLKAKIENCSSPDSLKVYVEQARSYAQKLAAEGKVAEARMYIAEVEPVVKEKSPELAGRFASVTAALDKVESVAVDKAGAAKESASAAVDSAKTAVGNAVDAVSAKAGEVKDAAAQKTREVKDAAAEKAQQAKESVSDAARQGVDEVKDLLK